MSYSSNNSSRKSQNRQPVAENSPQARRKPNKVLVFSMSGLIMLAMISFIILAAQGQSGDGKDEKNARARTSSVSDEQQDSSLGSPPKMIDQSMEANAARSGTSEFFPVARTVRFDKNGNPIKQ